MLPVLLAQWGIAIPRVSVLSLFGPVDEIGTVPVFRGTVFGRTEREDGVRRDGLHHDAWIVGRMDVRRTYRMDPPHEWSHAGEPVTRLGGVRGTEKRARNTACEVAAALPEWDAYRAWKESRNAEFTEALRRATEAREADDEGLLDVVF